MKKYIYSILGLLCLAQTAFAQNTNGGVRVRVVVSQVCSSINDGGDTDFIFTNSEELTWLVSAAAAGAGGAGTCFQLDVDATGGCYNNFNGSVIIDQYFTCAASVPASVAITLEGYEDDSGDRCTFNTGANDDDGRLSPTISTVMLPLPPNGTPVNTAFNVSGVGGSGTESGITWSVSGNVEVTQLPEAWDLGPAQIRCVECAPGGPTGGPGSCFYVDIPFTKSSSTVDGTLNIATNGGPANSGDDPNAGAVGVSTTGTMIFGPYTFNGSYDIDLTYASGNPAAPTCTREFKQTNVVYCIDCPDLATVHVDSDECLGSTVLLTATIDDPVTYLQGIDYFVQWQLNGVDILGASTYGPNGIDDAPPGPTGGDDRNALNYTHTVGWGTDPGNCAFEDQVYTAQLYCITDGTYTCGTAAKTNTDLVGACGPYRNYTQPLTCFQVDLSYLPPCAIAKEFTYEVHVASGAPFGSSWICEAVAEVHSPVGSVGPFCHPGITGDPASAAQCAFYPGDNEQSGTLNQETCSGGPGNGVGASNLGPNLVDLGGQLSTTPASGIWEVCVYDVFNDNGVGIEGVVNYVNLDVDYYLPPGCNINPVEDSQVDAVNQDATPLATAPLTLATHPEGAGLLTGVRVCETPVVAVDYQLPGACENEIIDLCGDLNIAYSADGNDGVYEITDPANLPAPVNGQVIYYRIFLDTDGDGISDCPDCATVASFRVTVGCCPTIMSATVSSEGCTGGTVDLVATVSSGVEGTDYYIQWLRNGVPIADNGASTVGQDGVYGTADDPASALSYTHTLGWGTDPGACGTEDQVFSARLYCLAVAPLELGTFDKTTTAADGSAGDYYNYTQPLTSFPIDLSVFPACAIATDFDYEVHLASGAPYGNSWICEGIVQVSSPLGGEGPFCHPGITDDPASAAQCALYPGDGEQAGLLNEETCSGGPGNGVGTNNIGPSSNSLGGINSTTPASGIWEVQVYDVFNDNGTGVEGVVNYVYLKVNYMLPPGCAINPASGSIVEAVNIDTAPLATAPLSGATNPNGAGLLTGVRVCETPTLNIDFEIAPDCAVAVTDLCGDLSIGYAASAAGPFDHTLADASSLVSSPPLDGEIWHYEIFVDTNGDNISDCPACATITGSHVIDQPVQPSSVINTSICQGGTLTTAQHLSAVCADCPGAVCGTNPCTADPACLGPVQTVPIAVGSNNADYEGVGSDACGLGSQTTTGTFDVNVVMPAIPPCATNIGYSLDYTINIYGGSFFGEVGINISGPLGLLGPFQPSPSCTSGTMSGTFASGSGDPTGLWTFNISDGYNDGGIDGNLAVVFNVTYDIPTIVPVPPVPADITWYDAQTGGNLQGSGSPLDPTGLFSQQGLFDINTPGNYTFWAQCGCGDCVGPRRAVTIQVVPKADGPLLQDQDICFGGSISTIVPIGSAIGSLFNIYAPGTTTPLNAAPQSTFTQANLTSYTPAFNPNAVGSTTYLITEVSTTAGVTCESNPAPITITVLPLPTPSASNSGPYCEGGTIEVSASGGAFYAWSGPGGFSGSGSPAFRFNATLAMAGTYTVTVTNLAGCTATASTVVVVNANPAAPAGTGDDMCIGASVPPLSAAAPAGFSCPSTPACTDPCAACAAGQPLGAVQTAVSSGSSSYEGDGGGGCSFDGSFATNPPLPVPHTPSIPACAQNVTFIVEVSGQTANGSFPGELNIQYNGPGGISGTIRPSTSCNFNEAFGPVTITSGSGTGAGTWTFGLADGYADNGVDGNVTITITTSYQVPTLPPPPPPATPTITWWNSPVGGTQQGSGSSFTPVSGTSTGLLGVFDATIPGTYTFFAQLECGACVSNRTPVSLIVNPNPTPAASNNGPICSGSTATVTAIGGASYAWNTGAATASFTTPALTANTTYTVTVSSASGCTATASTTVVVNPNPTATASNTGPYCEGGTIVLNATGGSIYAWSGPGGFTSNGSPAFRFNATLAMAGAYAVTVTDASGCTATASTVVVVNANPAAPAGTGDDMCIGAAVPALTATPPTCPGIAATSTTPGATGTIGPLTANELAGGPLGYDGAPVNFTYTYSLPPGAFITSIDYTIAGNQFNQYDDALITINGTAVYTGTTGSGASNFPYSASGTVSAVTNDPCGTPISGVTSFTATAVDLFNDGINPEGQLTTATITIHYQLPPSGICSPAVPGGPATITWWNSPVGGTQQGSGASFTPTSGTSTALSGVFNSSVPGTYTFFAQAECGACVSNRTPVSLIVNPNPTPAASNNGPICNGASATLTATGGVSYAWSNGAGTGSPVTVSPAATTTYTVTATDANGCTGTASTTVVVNANPVVTIAAPSYTVCEGGTVTIDGNVTSTTPTPYTHIWGGTGAPYLINANLSDPVFNAALATPGTYTLTYQIQDANGCLSNVASTSVTISTGGLPTISCPANITIPTGNSTCTAVYQPTAPTTNNGCYGTLNLTYTLSGQTTGSGTGVVPSTAFNLGATTVTYTVTDANNSTASATCSFTVTVVDTQAPSVSCPANITVSSAANACTASVTVPLPVVSDNCTALPVAISWLRSGATTGSGTNAATGTYNAGITIVTYTATDGAGNTAQCQLTVTVVENVLPTITCPGNLTRTVGADGSANCTYTATAAEISPVVSDNCTAVTVAGNVSYTAFGATSGVGTGAATLNFNVGTTFITYTVTDASGNTRQCSFSITVTDNLVPAITCPASPVTDVTDLNTCNALVSIAVPTTSDNCGVASVVNTYNNTPNASGVYPLGTTAVTYTVTDTYGNTATCSFNVVVTDAQVPSIACPANVTAVTGAGAILCSASVTVNSPIVFDNCTAAPLVTYVRTVATSGSGTGNASGTYNVGTTTVTYTATDNASNTASCSFTVTVTDNTPPVIVCTSTPYTANAATGACSATVTVPAPPATDNCTASGSITYTWVRSGATSGSGSGLNANGTYNVGTTTVTWTAADQYGNTSSCAVTVVVSDTQAPVLTCPAPVAAVNASSCSAFVTVPALGVNENCSGTAGVTFNIFNTNNLGNTNTLVRSGTGTNASGNFPIGISTIIYTVTDVAGNTSSCSTTVTVNDVVAPVIVCPTADDLTTTSSSDANGDCGAYIAIDPVTAYDNCNQITFTYVAIHEGANNITASLTGAGVGNNASGIYPVGQTTITYTATDAYGNSSTCFIRVTVNDDEAPGITCPNDVTQTADAGVCGAQVTMITPATSDNCAVASVVNNYNNTGNASDYYPVGTTVVTWTVTDVNGNTSTCSVSVTITDDEAPVLGPCPANIQSCVPVVLFGTPTATDNCQVASVTPSQASATAFAVGTTVVTYTAADDAGNTSTCSFTVTVLPMQGTLTVSNFNGYGVSCNGGNNGSATLTMTSGFAPYTFAWSNGFTQTTSGTSTASGLSAGNYSVTVTGNGVSCNYVRQFIIIQPLPLVCSITNTDVDCNTETGTATVNSSGGVAPYSYLWSNGATTQTATGLAAGIYSVTLTDANGCVCINTVEIRDSGTIIGNGVLVGNEYEGSGNTAIPTLYNVNTIEISGGTQPYQYDWNTSGYVQYSIHVNANGTVTITIVYADSASWDLTVTDSACQSEELYFDNQPDSPTSSTVLDITNYIITPDNGSQNGTIALTVEGGTPCPGGVYNYAWEGPTNFTGLFTNSPVQTGLVTGWYIVTVTDCSGQVTIGWYWVPKTVRGRGKAELASLLTDQNMQVYPNPFDSETNISFELPETAQANVEVFDLTGKSVAVLFNGTANAQEPVSLKLNANNLPAGSYLCRLTVEEWGASVVKQVFVIR